jgi:hypothetical protein
MKRLNVQHIKRLSESAGNPVDTESAQARMDDTAECSICGGSDIDMTMLTMEATIKLPQQKVIERVKSYFGAGGLGLKLVRDEAGFLTFEGGGGHVMITLCAQQHLTLMLIETREWEFDVRRFMQGLDG